MNYISHFHFHHKPDAHWHTLGLLLPDLLGNYNRRLRIPKGLAPSQPKPWQEELEAGIWQHHKADKVFHQSQFFIEGQHAVKESFARNGLWLPGIRSFFVTHILLELVLDRYLLRHHPHSGPCMYAHLDRISGQDAEQLLTGAQLEAAGFAQFYDRFTQSRYTLSYAEDESLLYALCRMLQRTRQNAYTPGVHLSRFSEAVGEIDEFVRANFERLEAVM